MVFKPLHRHPRESGDPYDVDYPMDPRFREDDGVVDTDSLKLQY